MFGCYRAHTTKEYTCYYVTVLEHSLFKALDILFDLYVNSAIQEKDVATEKQVILEEINMYFDTPDEHIHDLFSSAIWPNHALGKPILGTAETLGRINQAELKRFKIII